MRSFVSRHRAPLRHVPTFAIARVSPQLAALCATLLACGAAHAVEGGTPITPFGIYDFGAGMLPPPTDLPTVGVRTTTYHSSQLRDSQGKAVPIGVDLTVNSVGLVAIKMTKTTFLGANYGYGLIVPVMDLKLDLTIPTPAGPMRQSGSKRMQGDMQVMPLALQWVSPGLFQSAVLTVQAPTGSYDKSRLVNPGSNHWTLAPSYGITYIGGSGFELSSNLQLNLNSRNRDTGYRSGAELQHEFAAGQHVGDYTFGVGGFIYRQISDDHLHGANVSNRASVNGLGPSLSFVRPGSGLPAIWLHAYKEFNGKNRSQGTQVALRMSFTL